MLQSHGPGKQESSILGVLLQILTSIWWLWCSFGWSISSQGGSGAILNPKQSSNNHPILSTKPRAVVSE